MNLYSIFLDHPIVCTDSRACIPNSIFFALKGDNFNANAFAFTALEQGCAFAVVDEEEYVMDERFILVDNVLCALQELATLHREKLGTPIIAITGTNGKTTTKELTAAVLKEKYHILYTQGNLNNHIGVPLTLLQLKPAHEMAIVEMGANHPGEIKLLSEIVKPDFGLITNVGKAHLEGFGSFEGVKKTKAELYEYIAANGKRIFINIDNENLLHMVQESGIADEQMIKYSLHLPSAGKMVTGTVTANSPLLEMHCCLYKSNEVDIKTNLIGSYNAENVLAAVAVGNYFSVENTAICRALEQYFPQNNRSQLVETAKNKLIVDAYNANPSSMLEAIVNFSQIKSAEKLLILGDMLELGEQSFQEHQDIVDLLHFYNFEDVLLVGKNFKEAAKDYICFNNVSELISYLASNIIQHKMVLVKGSRGIKLEKIIDLL